MIEIQGLCKHFDDFRALEDIHMTMESGKVYGLIGQSGSGKSTLLRCINGLTTYEKGSLKVDGVEVSSLQGRQAREFRRGIGMIFQQFSLLGRLTVRENIALPMKCWKWDKRERERRVDELLEMVQLPDKGKALPRELSGGQKQRVAIARALAMNPKILLCDEATSALDPNIAETIMDLLSDINKRLGITIIVVTHQLSILKASCEQVYLLEKGRLAAQGDITSLFSQPPEALRRLMGSQGETAVSGGGEGTVLRLLPTPEQAEKPILSRMARELGEDFSVLRADREQYRHGAVTYLLIQVSPKVLPAVENWLGEQNIAWAAEPRQEKREEEAV